MKNTMFPECKFFLDAYVVRSFWNFMTHEYGSRVIKKESSVIMKFIARALNFFGIISADKFLHCYTTVIGKRIYIPFEIGHESEGYGFLDQIIVCAHEHQHIEQLKRDGWINFVGKYLLESSARAIYEAEAYGCNCELYFWFTGQKLSAEVLGAKLKDYGCKTMDIKLAKKILNKYIKNSRCDVLKNVASQKAASWF